MDYVAANPKATSADVAAALDKKGVKISAGYVSNIKSTSKAKGKRGRRAKVVARAGRHGAAPDLTAAAELVSQLGGIEQAKKAIQQLEAIEKLV